MPTISRTAARLAAAAAITTTLALAGGVPASAAPAPKAAPAPEAAPSTWTLVDTQLDNCVLPDDPRVLYFFVVLDGTWSKQITVDYTGLPAGVTEYSKAVIPPGSGDGHIVQPYLPLYTVHNAQLGHYVAQMRATDGAVTQSVDIPIDVQATC
ncbi:DUF5980 family protein [Actinoplanes sp. RD1]|uniref:DUF5980 family protein n=1 Tax=Actinoplanes sp. RD1 TaxID=3064538 RepID=UPI0027409913|nr:DUF5980 family protein [Actinoplanes sp. RD1]